MVNEIIAVQEYLSGKNIQKANLYHIVLLLARWFKEQGYSHLQIREKIFEWGRDNHVYINHNVNGIIKCALNDKRKLTDNIVIHVNSQDISEINRRFDSKKAKLVALAFLCYAKAHANRDKEFSVPAIALGSWLKVSRTTLQAVYIQELVDYEYIQIVDAGGWNGSGKTKATKYRMCVPLHNDGEYELVGNNIHALFKKIFVR